MKVVKLPVSTMFVNCYFYYDEDTKEGVVIDPGAEGAKLNSFIEDNGLSIKAILLTHGHFDHIGGVEEVRAYTKAPVVINENEFDFLLDSEKNESKTIGRKPISIKADKLLKDGEMIDIGKCRLKAIHTPGHTPGGVCYYDCENKIIFAGDTLFFESVGRSDLVCGNTEELLDAVRNKLFILEDDISVYPGHGQSTSIGHEKNCNPFVNMNKRD